MEIRTYAPVIIPTLNRYDHFRQCLESLENCTGADKTEVYIGLDYPPSEKYVEGWKKIAAYLPDKENGNGFKQLVVFRRKHNCGVGCENSNSNLLRKYVSEKFDCYIFSEDDNVFSPCFLDYMNKALKKYKDKDRIVSVSGYNHEEFYNQGQYNVFYSKDSCAWGLGLWKHKEERLKHKLQNSEYFRDIIHSYSKSKTVLYSYPACYQMLCDMLDKNVQWDDVKRTTINIIEGLYQVHPSISLVRNNGYDGSGVHCGVCERISRQIISTENYFELGDSGPWNTDDNRNALFHKCMPENNFNDAFNNIKQRMYKNTIPFYEKYMKLRHYIHMKRVGLFDWFK